VVRSRLYDPRRVNQAELIVERVLTSLVNGAEVLRHCRSALPPSRLELDFYVPELKLAVEVNGTDHSLSARQLSDVDKALLCERYFGITLIVVDLDRSKRWLRYLVDQLARVPALTDRVFDYRRSKDFKHLNQRVVEQHRSRAIGSLINSQNRDRRGTSTPVPPPC